MSVDAETEKKFLKKISESSNGYDEYDLGEQLNLNATQTDAVIKDRNKRLVEDDSSKMMIQDNRPRLRIRLTKEGKEKVDGI